LLLRVVFESYKYRWVLAYGTKKAISCVWGLRDSHTPPPSWVEHSYLSSGFTGSIRSAVARETAFTTEPSDVRVFEGSVFLPR
jgi:hypothetical protein